MMPNNEQSTIVLFAKLAPEMGYVFKEIGTRCPDAILEKDGKAIRVEFEYKAKTFQRHKHDPNDVDLIICWEDDWPESPLPVLSLERYVTLAESTPGYKSKYKPSPWQRWLLWRNRRRQAKLDRKNSCPICGQMMNIRCNSVEWSEDDEPYQWIFWSCQKCNRQMVKRKWS